MGIEIPTAETGPLEGKAATQERILVAAGQLFLERGYEGVIVADIAGLAGVSRATVFWHFSDKSTLFTETFHRLLVPFRNAIERDLSGLAASERLRECVTSYQGFVGQHREIIQGFLRWAMESPDFRGLIVSSLMQLHRRYLEVLRENLEPVLPPGSDAAGAAAGLLSMLHGNLLFTVFDPEPTAEDERRRSLDAMLELLLMRPGKS